MVNIYEVLKKWEKGELTVEAANAKLKGAGVSIDPHKNDITPGTEAVNLADASKINGYAMLDTGTGTMDKVEIRNGVIANMDCGTMYAEVVFGKGVVRQVVNNKIV